jgi:hypothetical protein
MPIDATSKLQPGVRLTITNTRILRLAFGTALSLWISQAVGWSISYIAPVITLLLLAMPLPRPKAKFFAVVVLALVISVYGSFIFLPVLLHQTAVGFLLLTLALFHSFYFSARGGAAVVGTLVTVGLAVTVAVGSVSVDALLAVAGGLTLGTIVGAAIAFLSHLLIADPVESLAEASANKKKDKPATIPLAVARRNAMRSLAIVLPITLWFLVSVSSASNMAVMIKVAAMGQEAANQKAGNAAKSLILSTLFGGVAAVIGWHVLSIWPSLTMYTLLIALAGLVFGLRIFAGRGLQADGDTWSYGFLTMIVVLAPAVLDGDFGSSADARFYDRLLMFVWATLYGVGAIYVFEAFWPRQHSGRPGNLEEAREKAVRHDSNQAKL